VSHKLRLAGRVCLALGIDDPEQWLHEASSRKIAFWDAFFQVEPYGNEWYRDAVQCTLLSNLIATVAATVGAKVKPSEVNTFMPMSYYENNKKVQIKKGAASIQNFQAWAQKFASSK